VRLIKPQTRREHREEIIIIYYKPSAVRKTYTSDRGSKETANFAVSLHGTILINDLLLE